MCPHVAHLVFALKAKVGKILVVLQGLVASVEQGYGPLAFCKGFYEHLQHVGLQFPFGLPTQGVLVDGNDFFVEQNAPFGLPQVAQVAKEIGYTRAMFVHGLDGLDEISLLGKTQIMELKDGEFKSYEIAPEDFGLKRCTLEEIRTGTPAENAATIRGVFSGKIRDARRDAVLLNAAGALIIGDKAGSFGEGIAKVAEIIDSGMAEAKLAELVEQSGKYAG